MSRWSQSLDRAFSAYLTNAGSGGSSGSGRGNFRRGKGFTRGQPGTGASESAVPPVPNDKAEPGTAGTAGGERSVPRSAASQSAENLAFPPDGTGGTAGTVETEHEAQTTDSPEFTDFDERATLVEYGPGVPRDWAEGFARLDISRRPTGFSEARWRQVIDDGARFLDSGCAEKAAVAGWTVTDVFGVHPRVPAARYDCMGLLPLIGGGTVVEVREDRAVIRNEAGNCLIYYLRRESNESVPVWELATADKSVEITASASPAVDTQT